MRNETKGYVSNQETGERAKSICQSTIEAGCQTRCGSRFRKNDGNTKLGFLAVTLARMLVLTLCWMNVEAGESSEQLSPAKNLNQNKLLTSVKRLPPQRQIDPRVEKAAQGMETMYVNYLLKVMRKTIKSSQLSLESNATRIYRSMLDGEYAKIAGRTQSFGLADQIIAYLDSSGYNVSKGDQRKIRDLQTFYPVKKGWNTRIKDVDKENDVMEVQEVRK